MADAAAAAPAVSATGVRVDGRAVDELRGHFKAVAGTLTRSSGSAFVELGTTQVAVAVHGPKQVEGPAGALADEGRVSVDIEFAAFSGRATKPQRGPDIGRQQLEELLREALTACILLERCPKAVIEVHCFVLECGGSEAAALAMAAALAVADAQIDMRCTLSAASLATIGRHLLVDPSAAEAERAERHVTVAMDASRRQLAHIIVGGAFAATELQDALELAEDACSFYDEQLREAMRVRAAENAS